METFLLIVAIALPLFILFFVARDDVLFFRRPMVRVEGTVIGHRISTDDGSTFYMAQIEFLDEAGQRQEVTDTYGARRAIPETGQKVHLIYPAGYPNRARPPRHILRAIIYLFLVATTGILLAKLFGFVGS